MASVRVPSIAAAEGELTQKREAFQLFCLVPALPAPGDEPDQGDAQEVGEGRIMDGLRRQTAPAPVAQDFQRLHRAERHAQALKTLFGGRGEETQRTENAAQQLCKAAQHAERHGDIERHGVLQAPALKIEHVHLDHAAQRADQQHASGKTEIDRQEREVNSANSQQQVQMLLFHRFSSFHVSRFRALDGQFLYGEYKISIRKLCIQMDCGQHV